jgi:hypothetical protein
MFTILRDKTHVKFYDKWYIIEPNDRQTQYNLIDCTDSFNELSRTQYNHSYFDDCDILQTVVLEKVTVKNKQGHILELYEQHNHIIIKYLEISRITKYLGIE